MKKKIPALYVHMLFSYLLILFIPLIIGFFLYSHIFTVTKKQSNTINNNMLNLVKREVDSRIDGIQTLSSRLAVDDNVQSLSYIKGSFGPEDQLKAHALLRNIQNVKLSDSLAEDIFVWFNNTDQVISSYGGMNGSMFYQLYFNSHDLTESSFREYMKQKHFMSCLSLHKADGSTSQIFTTTNFVSSIGEQTATVGISVNVSEINKILDMAKWNSHATMLILNGKNEIINSHDVPALNLDYESLKDGDSVVNLPDGNSSQMSVMKSDKTDWKYIVIVPVRYLETEAKDVRDVSVIGLFLCLFIGFFGSYFLTGKNYHPIKYLIDQFKKHGAGAADAGTDEYQWLKEQTDHLFREQDDLKLSLRNSADNLKKYYLTRLLEYPFNSDLENDLVRNNMVPDTKDHVVAVLILKDQNQDQIFYRFVVSNIFQEKISGKFRVEMVELGNRIGCIIDVPPGDDKVISELKNIIEGTQQIIEEKAKVTVSVLLGSVHRGTGNIHLSYMEAAGIEEYLSLLDSNFLSYDDIRNNNSGYEYPADIEQKIIRAIQAARPETAIENISCLIDDNLRNNFSIDVYHCLIFNILGTLVKGAEAGEYRNFTIDGKLLDNLLKKSSVDDLKLEIEELIRNLCEKISEERMNSDKDNDLSRMIDQYIEKEYANPDLNVSMIGDKFDLTPSYLSSLYKRKTGRSILDQINTVRIRQATELLNENCSVLDAAMKTGYRDSGSFIRVFKKKMGITPGSVRTKQTKA
jgi:AraC-like DNA-binding protein